MEGKEEGKEDQKLPAAPTASSEEVEERDVGKRKKGKKVYVAADFKFAQPLLKKHSVLPVFRSRKWFKKKTRTCTARKG